MRSPRRAGAARLDEDGSERRDVPEVAALVVFPTVRFFAATFFGVVFLTEPFFAALFFAGTGGLLKRTAALRLLLWCEGEPHDARWCAVAGRVPLPPGQRSRLSRAGPGA